MNSTIEVPMFLASKIIKSWETGNKIVRRIIIFASILLITAIIIGTAGNILYPEKLFPNENKIVFVLFLGSLTLSFLSYSVGIAYVNNIEREKKEEILFEKERKVAEYPNEPTLAWDLARTKLENYLNRNLSQVNAIFYLSVFVMIVGFGLMIYGAVMVFESPAQLKPSIVVAISGLITNFIGASFLIIYKSIMEQAEKYVNVLERINAVGMSVQVIDTITEVDIKLKNETKAELAKKLIDLYNKP